MDDDGHDIPASWKQMAATGTDAEQIAEHAVALWHGICDALSPIIG
jgi:hypothetical protein